MAQLLRTPLTSVSPETSVSVKPRAVAHAATDRGPPSVDVTVGVKSSQRRLSMAAVGTLTGSSQSSVVARGDTTFDPSLRKGLGTHDSWCLDTSQGRPQVPAHGSAATVMLGLDGVRSARWVGGRR